jgi:hypothetical protein
VVAAEDGLSVVSVDIALDKDGHSNLSLKQPLIRYQVTIKTQGNV